MEWPVCPVQTLLHSQGILYTPGVISLKLSLTKQKGMDFSCGETPFDVVLGQDAADLVEYRLDKIQEDDRVWLIV
jgi:hypothetical protein